MHQLLFFSPFICIPGHYQLKNNIIFYFHYFLVYFQKKKIDFNFNFYFCSQFYFINLLSLLKKLLILLNNNQNLNSFLDFFKHIIFHQKKTTILDKINKNLIHIVSIIILTSCDTYL